MPRVRLSEEERLQRRKDAVARYYLKNKEKINAYCSEYNKLEKAKQQKVLYRQLNKDKNAKHQSNRRAAINCRSVSWETELTQFVLEEAHHLRGMRDALTSVTWHVDHIIPLCGRTVSGLHVWNNFKVIPARDNLRKSNKYDASITK